MYDKSLKIMHNCMYDKILACIDICNVYSTNQLLGLRFMMIKRGNYREELLQSTSM